MSSWEAGEQTNLVTADQIATAECYNDWGSGLNDNVTVSGWTTDSTRYVKITSPVGQRHDGTPGTGFFLSRTTTLHIVEVAQAYTRVEWIEARNTQSGGFTSHAFTATASGCVFHGCIGSTTATSFARAFSSTAVNPTFESCLGRNSVYGFGGGAGSTRTVLNCVATGCTVGFDTSSSSSVAKNCVAYSNTTNWSGTWSASSTNNATSSASDDAPGGSSVWNVASSDFANAAGNDFHLASGSALIGAGANLYSTFTTDIDGDTWPSSGAWDIGFDYYASAAAASNPPRRAFPRSILNH